MTFNLATLIAVAIMAVLGVVQTLVYWRMSRRKVAAAFLAPMAYTAWAYLCFIQHELAGVAYETPPAGRLSVFLLATSINVVLFFYILIIRRAQRRG